MRRGKKDTLLRTVEREAKGILKMPGITAAERLKALELLTRVALAEHKISDGGADGRFFDK